MHKDMFVAPSTAFEWKTTIKSGDKTNVFFTLLHVCVSLFSVFDRFFLLIDSLRTEQSVTISKVSKRHVHANLSSHETNKTNGHPVTACSSKPCPSPRLGRPLYVRAQRSPRCVSDCQTVFIVFLVVKIVYIIV